MLPFVLLTLSICAIAVLLYMFFSCKKKIAGFVDELDQVNERRKLLMDFLHKNVMDIGEGADRHKIYERILRMVVLTSNASSACIYEKNNNKLKMVAVDGFFPPQHAINSKYDNDHITQAKYFELVLNVEELAMNEGVIGAVASEKKPMMILDVPKNPNIIKHDSPKLQAKSMIIAPIMFANNFYGVLAVATTLQDGTFSETDFSLISSVAELASLPLFNIDSMRTMVAKNKLEYDLDMASSVQSYLLPSSLPKVKGFDFAAKYIPQQKIGGDFFDVFELGNNKVALVIADVSGKGMSAAILMTMCQSKAKYIAKDTISPAATLKKLNDEMFSYMRRDMFITMIYAILDKTTGEVTLARAGHELPIIYKSSLGRSEKIKSKGMAIGMVDTKLFSNIIEEVKFTLDKGDMLLFYTDGVTEEVDSRGIEFSSDRLLNIMDAVHLDTPAYLNDGIVHAVQSFTGKSEMYDDDFTLLSMKRV